MINNFFICIILFNLISYFFCDKSSPQIHSCLFQLVWVLPKGISSGGTRNFFVGGIEGAKCDSEGAKIKKYAENGWFWPFFSSDWGGKWGAGPLTFTPHAPPPWCHHWAALARTCSWNHRCIWVHKKQLWVLASKFMRILRNCTLEFLPSMWSC